MKNKIGYGLRMVLFIAIFVMVQTSHGAGVSQKVEASYVRTVENQSVVVINGKESILKGIRRLGYGDTIYVVCYQIDPWTDKQGTTYDVYQFVRYTTVQQAIRIQKKN